MSATKILWGQISIVFLIILATTWGATQYVAWSLGYQAQLGPPWFELFGTPIYYPPAIFWWWYFYEAYAPPIFAKGGIIAASGGFIAIAVAIGMSVWRAREAKGVATYGSARWASKPEVKAAGLLDPDGVILGRYEREYLRHDGPEHVLCFAPTRSGKGVGLVVPTLLTWPGSAIVHDIKGENWQLIGEVRGAEALDLLKVWGTGHPGGIGTIHAGSGIGALRRLEQLIQEAVVTVPRAMIAETIDLVAVLAGRGSARRLVELARVEGLGPDGDYRISPAFSEPETTRNTGEPA